MFRFVKYSTLSGEVVTKPLAMLAYTDLGGSGNGQHVDHALGDAGMHRVHRGLVT